MRKDPTAFKQRFEAYKNGKSIKDIYDGGLPRYAEGKTVIGSNVDMKDDGTFTDDYTKAFDDIIITPQGPRVKPGQLYKYQEPWDDEKFMNAVTVGGLNNLSPAQWARRGYDLINGNLTAESWLNGNAGIVPDNYSKEHPGMAMAANALFDFWTLGGPSLLKSATNIRRLNPVQYTKYEPQIQPIQQTQVQLKPVTPQPYQIENIPGYQLKSLMRGNPLEKQLSKSGTISVNSIRAQANKASQVEKAVIEKVLGSEEFAGQKSIDYNKFRRAVHDDLITYDVNPDGRFETYGMDRLGFDHPEVVNRHNHTWNTAFYEARDQHPDWTEQQLSEFVNNILGPYKKEPRLNTYTFSSDKIPVGSSKHYDSNTLGHSRTYTIREEPDVLHVMESQSDWGQSGREKQLLDVSEYNRRMTLLQQEADDFAKEYQWLQKEIHESGSDSQKLLDLFNRQKQQRALLDDRYDEISRLKDRGYSTPQSRYLSDNYTQRQIQENLKFAAEKGQTKMRYPTSETAAKIEGYQKGFGRTEETDRLQREIRETQAEFEEAILLQDDPFIPSSEKQRVDDLEKKLNTLRSQFDEALMRAPKDYSPEHKTILKKYSDFPKQYRKLYKNADVRTITDGKGNTWYEVDVPKDYLNSEWQYGFAPWLIGGGTAATLGSIPEYANGKLSGYEDGKYVDALKAIISPFRYLRNRMYRTVSPSHYNTEQISNFIKGKDRTRYQDPNTEAVYGMYTKQDSVNTQQYGPFFRENNIPYRTVGQDEYGDPVYRVAVKDIIKSSNKRKGAYEFKYPNLPGQYPLAPKGNVGDKKWLHSHTLGGYHKGTSKDKNGIYDYYEDTWDINPFKGYSAKHDGSDLFRIGNKLGLDYFNDIVPWGNPVKIYGTSYQK